MAGSVKKIIVRNGCGSCCGNRGSSGGTGEALKVAQDAASKADDAKDLAEEALRKAEEADSKAEEALDRECHGVFPWSEAKDYEVPALVFGEDGEVYLSIQESGPGTEAGPRNPVEDREFWKPVASGEAGIGGIGSAEQVVYRQDGTHHFPVRSLVLAKLVGGGGGGGAGSINNNTHGKGGNRGGDTSLTMQGLTHTALGGSGGNGGVGIGGGAGGGAGFVKETSIIIDAGTTVGFEVGQGGMGGSSTSTFDPNVKFVQGEGEFVGKQNIHATAGAGPVQGHAGERGMVAGANLHEGKGGAGGSNGTEYGFGGGGGGAKGYNMSPGGAAGTGAAWGTDATDSDPGWGGHGAPGSVVLTVVELDGPATPDRDGPAIRKYRRVLTESGTFVALVSATYKVTLIGGGGGGGKGGGNGDTLGGQGGGQGGTTTFAELSARGGSGGGGGAAYGGAGGGGIGFEETGHVYLEAGQAAPFIVGKGGLGGTTYSSSVQGAPGEGPEGGLGGNLGYTFGAAQGGPGAGAGAGHIASNLGG